MPTSTDSLRLAWRDYRIALDSIRVARKSLAREHQRLAQGTRFADCTTDKTMELIGETKSHLEHYAVLSLWIAFERELRQHMIDQFVVRDDLTSKSARQRFTLFLESSVENARPGDLLDMFKPDMDKNLVGWTKQIKQYRDWVAHRNPKKTPPSHINPERAYIVLSKFLEALSVSGN